MSDKHIKNALLSKAFADTSRLMIVEMLSCGELCGCKILEKFNFTQPTLSHHMKILCDCGLVSGRKESKWTYYTLNSKAINDYLAFIGAITDPFPKTKQNPYLKTREKFVFEYEYNCIIIQKKCQQRLQKL